MWDHSTGVCSHFIKQSSKTQLASFLLGTPILSSCHNSMMQAEEYEAFASFSLDTIIMNESNIIKSCNIRIGLSWRRKTLDSWQFNLSLLEVKGLVGREARVSFEHILTLGLTQTSLNFSMGIGKQIHDTQDQIDRQTLWSIIVWNVSVPLKNGNYPS